jgi:hypothetical protein
MPYHLVAISLQERCFEVSLENRPAVKVQKHNISYEPSEERWLCRGSFVLKRGAVTVMETNASLKSVTFNIVNFVDFFFHLGGEEPEGKSRTVRLQAQPCIIDLTATENSWQIAESLRAEGGYRVTHQGDIQRSDGRLFSLEDVRHLLEGIELFLSFAKGAHCGFPIVSGVSEAGIQAWQQVGINDILIRPWRTAYTSWFDPHHGKILADVFPGFWHWFKKSKHGEPMRWALDWYILGNEAHVVEAGLILVQAALERLTTETVGEKPGKKTGKWITKALKSRGIPDSIPDSCQELGKVAVTHSWENGPHALTEIRAGLVHHKQRDNMTSGAYSEAWNLGLWYVELLLLHEFGYNGDYGNRLKDRRRGQVESVPWLSLDEYTS